MKENLDSQVIYGTLQAPALVAFSIDEIVRFEKNGQGTMFAFQDANWNVTSTVNYAAVPLDRIYTTPYGEPTFDAVTINGDYDGDGDIDSADSLNFGSCDASGDPPTGACRVFDFDNDADVDSADQTTFNTLYTPFATEIYRQPAHRTSANGFPFAHQGLRFDEETATYQNRNRQYNPRIRRFPTRDPVHIGDGPPGPQDTWRSCRTRSSPAVRRSARDGWRRGRTDCRRKAARWRPRSAN